MYIQLTIILYNRSNLDGKLLLVDYIRWVEKKSFFICPFLVHFLHVFLIDITILTVVC